MLSKNRRIGLYINSWLWFVNEVVAKNKMGGRAQVVFVESVSGERTGEQKSIRRWIQLKKEGL